MSDIDDAIRRDVHEQLDRVVVREVAVRAGAVRAEVRRRRRRTSALSVAATLLLACALVGLVSLRGQHSPPPVDEPSHRLRVVRTLSAASLGLADPQAAAIGPNGNLYITDATHQTITEATPAGRVIRTWGGEGTRPGQFRLADGGIAIDHRGRVYVADSGNARIEVFTSKGRFLRQMGSFGDGPGQFQFPWAIAVGPDGSIYVSDDRQATLTKLSPNGHQEWRLGGQGTPPDLVGHTHFGSFATQGQLVVADDDSGRVVYITPSGTEADAFGTGASGDRENTLGHPPATDFPQGACDTTLDSNNNVYVGGCAQTKQTGILIHVYSPTHQLIGIWRRSALSTAPRFGPSGLAVAVGTGSRTIVELEATP